jgi:membrane protein DedA with SNARE-associated domain
MNLSLAFFHGEQALVGLVLAGLIVVVVVPLVFYVWLRRTKASELKLTLTYVISTAVICALNAFSTKDPTSLFQVTVFILAFILTLPWNVITLVVVSLAGAADIGDRELVATMLLGAGVNAMILFFLARKAKRWRA